MRTLLAVLISRQEGFGIPGTVPTTHRNPGDLRHSPRSSHTIEDPNAIGMIDTVADGWADLERQLQLDASRGLTIGQTIREWAPPSDGNNTDAYLAFILAGFHGQFTADSPLSEVLKVLA